MRRPALPSRVAAYRYLHGTTLDICLQGASNTELTLLQRNMNKQMRAVKVAPEMLKPRQPSSSP